MPLPETKTTCTAALVTCGAPCAKLSLDVCCERNEHERVARHVQRACVDEHRREPAVALMA